MKSVIAKWKGSKPELFKGITSIGSDDKGDYVLTTVKRETIILSKKRMNWLSISAEPEVVNQPSTDNPPDEKWEDAEPNAEK